MSTNDWLRTDIGTTTADSITVRGHDLAGELMGKVTFTELAFLLVQGRMPEPGETTLLDAVLVSLADHGLTPTVLAARLTHTGAPESLQGSVAAACWGRDPCSSAWSRTRPSSWPRSWPRRTTTPACGRRRTRP